MPYILALIALIIGTLLGLVQRSIITHGFLLPLGLVVIARRRERWLTRLLPVQSPCLMIAPPPVSGSRDFAQYAGPNLSRRPALSAYSVITPYGITPRNL